MNGDIFAFAEKQVGDKGFLTRMGHAPVFHGIRSAFSSPGSFGSKALSGVGAGVRWTLSLIPIPVIGSLISEAEKALEGYLRSLHYNAGTTGAGLEKKVKFELKDLNIEDLDRYRWKVKEAIDEVNRVMSGFDNDLRKQRESDSPCNVFYAAAEAIEQAYRRNRILKAKCTALAATMASTTNWITKLETGADPAPLAAGQQAAAPANGGLNKHKEEVRKLYDKYVQDEQTRWTKARASLSSVQASEVSWHKNCDPWCIFKGSVSDSSNRATIGQVAKVASIPLKFENFNPFEFMK